MFVVGMNGSGTTMVLDHLNSHSALFGFRLETKILPYYLRRYTKFGDLALDDNFQRLFDEMRSAFPFRKVNKGRPVELPDGWRDIRRTPAAIFDFLMCHFASLVGKRRWCEKSPMHVMHIAELAEAWPEAQFIHVIRDGRNCAASFHRRWGYSPQASMYRWKRCIREGRRQGRPLGQRRYLEVYYEELTAEPERVLSGVCRFLEVGFEDSVMGTSRSAKRVRGLDSNSIRPNDRTFADYFPKSICESLERIGGVTLSQLGYSASYPDSDADPPALMLRYWMLRDRLRAAANALFGSGDEKSRPSGSYWNLVFKKLQRGLRQSRTDEL